jgi:phosphatidylglycerol:prolipoprotein diacylglycerol transferase
MREILFQNALLTVKSLNILIAIGFLFTGTYVIRYVERHKMNLNFLTRYFVHITLTALLAGRLAYVLENISDFLGRPVSVLFIWDLKFSFFGVLLGAAAMLFYQCKKNKEDFWGWFDALFLSTLAMLIFVHLGFFFNGTNYGLPTDLPWGITFEAANIPFVTPIHPTQLYALLLTIILLIYSNIKSKRTHLSGVVSTSALMIYSIGMLGIDFLHGAPSLYIRVAYGAMAILAFVAHIQATHKTHINK